MNIPNLLKRPRLKAKRHVPISFDPKYSPSKPWIMYYRMDDDYISGGEYKSWIEAFVAREWHESLYGFEKK